MRSCRNLCFGDNVILVVSIKENHLSHLFVFSDLSCLHVGVYFLILYFITDHSELSHRVISNGYFRSLTGFMRIRTYLGGTSLFFMIHDFYQLLFSFFLNRYTPDMSKHYSRMDDDPHTETYGKFTNLYKK